MNCTEVLELIEDYHCGELEPLLASQVAVHLNGCPDCTKNLELLAREDNLFRSYSGVLDQDIDVRAGMWNAVRSELAARPETRRSDRRFASWLGLDRGWLPDSRLARATVFALLVASVSVCGTLLAVRMFAPPQGGVASNMQYSDSRNSLDAAMRSVQRAEFEYLEAIRILSDVVEKQRQTLDPGQRAELDRNLRALDQAIVTARKAYQAHPSDPELVYHMLAAYRDKVELLQELAIS